VSSIDEASYTNTNHSFANKENAYLTVDSLNLQLDKFLDNHPYKKSEAPSSNSSSTVCTSSSNNKVFIDSLNEIYSKIHSEIYSIKELILNKSDSRSVSPSVDRNKVKANTLNNSNSLNYKRNQYQLKPNIIND